MGDAYSWIKTELATAKLLDPWGYKGYVHVRVWPRMKHPEDKFPQPLGSFYQQGQDRAPAFLKQDVEKGQVAFSVSVNYYLAKNSAAAEHRQDVFFIFWDYETSPDLSIAIDYAGDKRQFSSSLLNYQIESTAVTTHSPRVRLNVYITGPTTTTTVNRGHTIGRSTSFSGGVEVPVPGGGVGVGGSYTIEESNTTEKATSDTPPVNALAVGPLYIDLHLPWKKDSPKPPTAIDKAFLSYDVKFPIGKATPTPEEARKFDTWIISVNSHEQLGKWIEDGKLKFEVEGFASSDVNGDCGRDYPDPGKPKTVRRKGDSPKTNDDYAEDRADYAAGQILKRCGSTAMKKTRSQGALYAQNGCEPGDQKAVVTLNEADVKALRQAEWLKIRGPARW